MFTPDVVFMGILEFAVHGMFCNVHMLSSPRWIKTLERCPIELVVGLWNTFGLLLLLRLGASLCSNCHTSGDDPI